MILSKTTSTAKQRTEFRLLVSIRFACLMASEYSPVENQRVQKRLAELNNYLKYNQPTQLFHNQYCRQAGELGNSFTLKVCQITQQASVYRTDNDNVHQLALA